MALIKCPECGNNISDKAEACIHCGFPLKEYVENMQVQQMPDEEQKVVEEIPRIEVQTACFENGYVLVYDNGSFEFKQDNDIIYSGDTTGIRVYELKKSMFNSGTFSISFPKEKKVYDGLRCIDSDDAEACEKIKENYDLRTKEKREVTEKEIQEKQRIDNLVRQNIMCPHCHSLNIKPRCITYAAREDKIKTSYNINVNPLKLFTVLNKKEKVIRRGHPGGTKVVGYICIDCGMEWKPEH